MRIARHFTTAGTDAYEGVDFEQRESRIVNPDGSVVFEAADIMMPKGWSQVAVDIMAQKYFRKAGVPAVLRPIAEDGVPEWLWSAEADPTSDDTVGEQDSRQVFRRLAGTWTYWAWKQNYFDGEEDAQTFFDELSYMMATQRAAPNSPQWFNTGLHWAYGIAGPAQGHWFVPVDGGEPQRSTSAYERPQPHACFIQSVSDDLVNDGGIMDLWIREARIFKYGSGTGSNFSRIRGEDEPLSGGGRSSGLMSFLKIGDRAAGAIKSGGTTRRAAKMVILDVDHPDIEQFIDWKSNEEQKVAALVTGSRVVRRHLNATFEAASESFDVAANRPLRRALSRARRDGVPEGYLLRVLQLAAQGAATLEFAEFDTDWQGEAYQTVSGQNANNSVRVTADFLKAVDRDANWDLIRRTDGEVHRTVRAREIWDRVARAAWQSADPGLQYDTTINEWHTSPAQGRIEASNPCSEYMFLDDTACNLASINLMRFVDADGVFDIPAYEHATRLWTVVLEISVLMAQFPSREIAQRSFDYRTLGLGYANLGAMLMVEGIPYDSPQALAWTGALTAILTGVAYSTSAEMAGELGTFPRYEENREAMLRVIRNHRRAAYGAAPEEYEGLTVLPTPINSDHCPTDLLAAARESWDHALALGEQHGYRNAQSTLIAPTGTIGLLMDCDTTGVEPDFALVKFKKLAGGGYFRIINDSVPDALRRLGYTHEQVAEIVDYCAGSGLLEGAPHLNRNTLAQRGFTRPALDAIDKALSTAFHVSFAFNRYVLGDDFCRDALGFTDLQLDDPAFDLLSALGFSPQQVDEANDHILGRMTTEGAPHLREEHYAVLDCATRCGKYGTRFIEPMAHVRTMSAAQPFISGAISKTINMPNEATIDEVRAVYDAAAEGMVKALALYRDGSKLSQPLAASITETLTDEEEDAFEEGMDQATAAAGGGDHPAIAEAERIIRSLPATQQAQLLKLFGAGGDTEGRRRLPARRQGYGQKARVGGHAIYLHTGEFEDGDLGEIFVSMAKDGAAFRSLMNCFAIAVSIGLQHGVPLEAFVDSFVFTKFEPNGMVTGHDRIQMATSIIDYVFRELAVSYLGRDDLAHLGPLDLADGETGEGTADGFSMSPGALEPDDAGAGSGVTAPALTGAIAVSDVLEPAGGSNGAAPAARQPEPVPVVATATATEVQPLPIVDAVVDAVASAAPAPAAGASPATASMTSPEMARQRGFEGDPCDDCGQMMMVRNGTCLKCVNCGATSGCS
ncbi:MAG TPA: vitamin B12-dependent ribonucleotide reductase [Dehalococcoidia bacterium]|nr:vitamin B12-dependent ribonucleotide reductase [Dehalococcoidia bacterium]